MALGLVGFGLASTLESEQSSRPLSFLLMGAFFLLLKDPRVDRMLTAKLDAMVLWMAFLGASLGLLLSGVSVVVQLIYLRNLKIVAFLPASLLAGTLLYGIAQETYGTVARKAHLRMQGAATYNLARDAYNAMLGQVVHAFEAVQAQSWRALWDSWPLMLIACSQRLVDLTRAHRRRLLVSLVVAGLLLAAVSTGVS